MRATDERINFDVEAAPGAETKFPSLDHGPYREPPYVGERDIQFTYAGRVWTCHNPGQGPIWHDPQGFVFNGFHRSFYAPYEAADPTRDLHRSFPTLAAAEAAQAARLANGELPEHPGDGGITVGDSAERHDNGTTQWDGERDERAAAIEYDAGISRDWAEGFARLDPNHPPGDVPSHRWLLFIGDIGRFLDSDWAAKAMALGWGPYDLFGCDRIRPFARIDQLGLCWLLNSNRLIALTEHTATIETPSGARQTYRRKPSGPGRVLAWELVDDRQ
jgi:hypothetical protein